MPTHITVPRGSPRVQYIGNGTQTAFPFPFPIFADSDLEVWLGSARQSSGYTLSGTGASAGGAVTFATAPVTGAVVTLNRRVPLARVTDFLESGPLSATALNTELDILTACLQQVADDQERMLRYDATDLPATAVLPGRSARAGQVLAFDSSGNPTTAPQVNSQALSTFLAAGTGAVSRPIRDKLADQVSVKDFGAVGDGVADDTNAIQTALTAANAVFLPSGTYRTTAPLTLSFGKSLTGTGHGAVIQADGNSFDVVQIVDGYTTLSHLRIRNGNAAVKLWGRDGPCVQNALTDLVLWEPRIGLVLDGHTDTTKPCYWNNLTRILIARPAQHGVWFTRGTGGDTPNANRLTMVRVYSLSAPMTGSGFYIEYGRYNNAFVDCEANLHTTAHSCFRVGALTDKNLIVNFYAETLAAIPNVVLEAGSQETAIINLFSASAGPAIQDLSGGRYTAINAGYPEKNRLERTRIRELVVEALRYDTEYLDPAGGGLITLDLTSSVYLISAYNGAVEARLPAASQANGHAVTLKKTDASANVITVTENSGSGPDGRSVLLANRYDQVTVVSNGANWWIVGGNNLPGSTFYHQTPGVFQPSLMHNLYLVSAYSGAVEVRLPAPSAPQAVGRCLTIKKSDVSGNVVTVTQSGGTGPDNAVISLSGVGHALTVMSNGAAWHIISRYS